jgi:hypothetical protein
MPKMNVNLYVIEDYENETAFRPKKTNPNKPNFKPGENLLESTHAKMCVCGRRLPLTGYF